MVTSLNLDKLEPQDWSENIWEVYENLDGTKTTLNYILDYWKNKKNTTEIKTQEKMNKLQMGPNLKSPQCD